MKINKKKLDGKGKRKDSDKTTKKTQKMIKLNCSFVEACKRFVERQLSIEELISRYKKFIKTLKYIEISDIKFVEDETCEEASSQCSESSVDNASITNQIGSDMVDEINTNDVFYNLKRNEDTADPQNCEKSFTAFGDDTLSKETVYTDKRQLANNIFDGKVMTYDNEADTINEHVCSSSVLYKFLIHFYGVECPKYRRFYVQPEAPKIKPEPYNWPFMTPPTKPRSVFDTGPTREEVGEYNRSVFDAVTFGTFPYPRDIQYRFNPNFYDDDSDEYLKEKNQIYKSDVELYTYEGDVFVYNDLVVLRIYEDCGERILLLKTPDGDFRIESPLDNFKFIAEEEGNSVDVLYLMNYTIYRLLFRGRLQVERIMRTIYLC